MKNTRLPLILVALFIGYLFIKLAVPVNYIFPLRGLVVYKGNFVSYALELQDFDRKRFLLGADTYYTLEPDVYKSGEHDGKVYVIGFSGYTVIDLKENEVKQYIHNWGKTDWNRATRPEVLQEIWRINYVRLASYDEFTEDEKKGFRMIGYHNSFTALKLSSIPYLTKEYGKIKLTSISNICKIRVADLVGEEMIEDNLKALAERNGKLYLEGDFSTTVVDLKTHYIVQKVKKPVSEVSSYFRYIQENTEKGRYQLLEKDEDFPDEDQQVFREMRENPEKYASNLMRWK
jgi:hypothetical protein